MKVLVACEYSGMVRNAMLAKGFDAWSCDILPDEGGRPDRHIQGDVRPHLRSRWDLIIAHPPCTFLCNSGVRWLYHTKGKEDDLSENNRVNERWALMHQAADFFNECLNANAPYIAVENPVMHKHAARLICTRPKDRVHPYHFGDPYSKMTCFWIKGFPRLFPCYAKDDYTHIDQEVWRMAPSKDRAKQRSKTYPDIARAIADQWGEYVKEKISD